MKIFNHEKRSSTNHENEQMNKKQRLSFDSPDLCSPPSEYILEVTQSDSEWANKKRKNNYIVLTVWLHHTDNRSIDPDMKKKLKLTIYYQNSDNPLEDQSILKICDPKKLTIYGSNKTEIPVRIEGVSSRHGGARFVIKIELENDYNVKVWTDSIYVVSVFSNSKQRITNENPSDSNQITSSTMMDPNNHLEDEFNDSMINAIILLEDEYIYSTMTINNQIIQQQSNQQNLPEDEDSSLDLLCDFIDL